ncbi:MAG: prolipoprotein diacylglyceryl transferase [Burkholderiales bacterium]|nr:prolipoprotein diacylglyceryl transferase [Burkholderiales bacterium]
MNNANGFSFVAILFIVSLLQTARDFMLTYPQIDPVVFSVGPFSIGNGSIGPLAVHWYGVMYLVAFIIFYALGKYRIHRGRHAGWETRDLDDLLFYGVIGIIVGARLGYVLFYKPAYYLENPLEIIQLWHGGMSFHGGFLGVLTAMTVFAWLRRKPWLEVSDFTAPLAPLGLAAGRLGNFINGELWGKPTALPWGMIFPHADDLPRHPSQLYELALEGVVLFIVLWWFSAKSKPRGAVSALFLIGYGLFRFLIEYVREPDGFLPELPLHFSMGQWLSLPMMLAGIALLMYSMRKPGSDNQNHGAD